MKILVTGATGLIGKSLIYRLLIEGHEVRALARSPEKVTELPKGNVYSWSDDKVPEKESLVGCEAIIHLAGEGIADQRWTRARKQRLCDSRVEGTKNLISGLKLLRPDELPRVLISASAIGYYGSSSAVKDEDSAVGTGFLAKLCDNWEKESAEAEKLGIQTVILRTGLVLAHEGGLLSKAAPIILGSGKQWMSWIHIEDLIRFIIYALQNRDLKGPYNLTAPNPVTNKAFTKAIAKIRGFPFVVKAPTAALKMVLGELTETVLANQNIESKKVIASGFDFCFKDLLGALDDLVGKRSILDNQFVVRQFIPLNPKQVFSFFSRAENLEILTPPWLHFHISKNSSPEIKRGSLIEYKLRIHGFPVRWKTLISEWSHESFFVDEQLKGPYNKWHHLHEFEAVAGGTLISDRVTYRVPGSLVGKLLLLPFIRRDVSNIFKYRTKKIRELFDNGASVNLPKKNRP